MIVHGVCTFFQSPIETFTVNVNPFGVHMACCNLHPCPFRYVNRDVTSRVLHPFGRLLNQSEGMEGIKNHYKVEEEDEFQYLVERPMTLEESMALMYCQLGRDVG